MSGWEILFEPHALSQSTTAHLPKLPQLLEEIKKNTSLTSLCLRNCYYNTGDLPSILKAVHPKASLTNLEIDGRDTMREPDLLKQLSELIQRSPLVRLRLTRCSGFPQSISALVSAIAEHKSLSAVDFSNSEDLNDQFPALIEAIRKNSNIKEFAFPTCTTHNNHMMTLASFVPTHKSLVSLAFTYSPFATAPGDPAIYAKLFENNASLLKLSIMGASQPYDAVVKAIHTSPTCAIRSLALTVSDSGLDLLCDYLRKTTTLRSLSVRTSHLPVGNTKLGESFVANTTLTALDISWCVDATIATNLMNSLPRCTGLRSLGVHKNKGRDLDPSTDELSQILPRLSSLETLSMTGIRFSGAEGKAFFGALGRSATLRKLWLSDCSFDGDAGAAFLNALKLNSSLTSLSVVEPNENWDLDGSALWKRMEEMAQRNTLVTHLFLRTPRDTSDIQLHRGSQVWTSSALASILERNKEQNKKDRANFVRQLLTLGLAMRSPASLPGRLPHDVQQILLREFALRSSAHLGSSEQTTFACALFALEHLDEILSVIRAVAAARKGQPAIAIPCFRIVSRFNDMGEDRFELQRLPVLGVVRTPRRTTLRDALSAD